MLFHFRHCKIQKKVIIQGFTRTTSVQQKMKRGDHESDFYKGPWAAAVSAGETGVRSWIEKSSGVLSVSGWFRSGTAKYRFPAERRQSRVRFPRSRPWQHSRFPAWPEISGLGEVKLKRGKLLLYSTGTEFVFNTDNNDPGRQIPIQTHGDFNGKRSFPLVQMFPCFLTINENPAGLSSERQRTMRSRHSLQSFAESLVYKEINSYFSGSSWEKTAVKRLSPYTVQGACP